MSCVDETRSSRAWVLTSGKHALHKVVDIAENNSEALRGALLPNQRFDLDALQDGLRYSAIGILTGVEYRTEEQRKCSV